MGTLLEGFVFVWIFIIGFIPNFFLAGLTICIVGTLLTYLERSRSK